MSSTQRSEPTPPKPPGYWRRTYIAVGILVVGLVIVFGSRFAAGGGAVLLVLGAFLVIAAIIFGGIVLAGSADARRLSRLQRIEPTAFVFTFESNQRYQNSVVELRDHGIIDPDTRTDSEDPKNGPRWASATPDALSFWRGYGPAPQFVIRWPVVGDLFAEIETLRIPSRYGPQQEYGVSLIVHSGSNDLNMILRNPSAAGMPDGGTVADIAARLNQLRAG